MYNAWGLRAAETSAYQVMGHEKLDTRTDCLGDLSTCCECKSVSEKPNDSQLDLLLMKTVM